MITLAGRPVRTDGKLRVSIHINNGYRYASSQPYTIDEKTGKKKYNRIHWGIVDDNLKFIPKSRYIYASMEERQALDFPNEWDLSEIDKLICLEEDSKEASIPTYNGEDMNRLYGHIWLMEQVALETGIRQDLETIFENKAIVDDIMTLAMYSYLSDLSYNRIARWQEIERYPSERELSPTDITRLTQSITEKHRMELLHLRSLRLEKNELCAVDTTTRSAYGSSLADIKWGRNKEGLPLEQTLEVVVYTLDSHMPVYYRTFPGNIPDSRCLDTILLDLEHAGFNEQKMVLITDRGFETIQNLKKYILKGQAMIMCTKVQQKHVLDKILRLGEFSTIPEGMQADKDLRVCYQQYDIGYDVEGSNNEIVEADRLKLNLYFDVTRRGEELFNLKVEIEEQRVQLEEFLTTQAVLDDDKTLRSAYNYFKIKYDCEDRTILSYELDEKKIAKAKRTSGFFAITTHKLDMSAIEVFQAYRLRDEQEKYFQQMKSQTDNSRQRNSSEDGKTGRLFILFVTLILSSHTRHIWRTTNLYNLFSSTLEVLDEMRSIRCIEHKGKERYITPFVADELSISEAFGFPVPEGCAPDSPRQSKSYRSKRSHKKTG